jgi:hypothetical protein
MLTLPAEMIALLAAFEPEFSKPVWLLAQVLLVGTILAPHKRTVTSALRAMGLSQEKSFDKYHRVLYRDRWSGLHLSRILLVLLVTTFVAACNHRDRRDARTALGTEHRATRDLP